ncbi:MAG TPA: response regulator transcription factor [Streptosporangiaceae bacterium]|nr:response regulator transcription factor [Streptosporangiaceae bacterium]
MFIYEPESSFQPKPGPIIAQSPDLQLIGTTKNLDRASYLTRFMDDRIDVMLLSCAITSKREIDVVRHVQPIRTLVLSHTHDDDAVIAALSAGARGYMSNIPSDLGLLRAIKLVESGGAAFCRIVAHQLTEYFASFHRYPGHAPFPDLTDREREILDLIARGLSNRQISRQLVVADKTVRNHITHIFAKIAAPNRAAAIVKARNAGIGINWAP